MQVDEKVTVRDLVKKLLEFPMDQEVLFEETDSEIFCIVETPHVVEDNAVVNVVETVEKPAKKNNRGRKPVLTAAEKEMHRRDYYNNYYGATAFKYGYNRWTPAEDALVLAHPEDTDMILSELMHRSIAAIHTRRYNLRKKGMS